MQKAYIKALDFKYSGLDREEWRLFKSLSSPNKVQDFLNGLHFNFEKHVESHHSPRFSLKKKRAHCFEGALLAAAAFWINGRRPLLLDLVAISPDFDHVVTLFKEGNCWGAVSKTNHAVLRYRDPIYRNIRELVMSYFHEYFLTDGRKTLRSFSEPFDLSRFGAYWLTTPKSLMEIESALDSSPHRQIMTAKQIKFLRRADDIEIRAGRIVEYKE